MEDNRKYLYAKDSEKLQLTHDEYLALMEKAEEAKRLQQVKNAVMADLQCILDGDTTIRQDPPVEERIEQAPVVEAAEVPQQAPPEPEVTEPEVAQPETAQPETAEPEVAEPETAEPEVAETETPEPEVAQPETAEQEVAEPEPQVTDTPEVEKVSVEFSAEESVAAAQPAASTGRADMSDVPPIKNEITEHFNRQDESGRLSNVFKQYYTCLNEACGGTIRVTMKDGFCSLWNYDEWEEFAFVDIFEGLLRISIDPRYTDALKSLSLCEAPRLISSRRNVICVQIDDLNNTVLEVLVRAFSEVGVQVG